MDKQWRFQVGRNFCMRGFDLWIGAVDMEEKKWAIVPDVKLEDANPTVTHEPTMGLTEKEAQQLFDELWKCGCRPTFAPDNAGALEATVNHLKDLQRIIFSSELEVRRMRP